VGHQELERRQVCRQAHQDRQGRTASRRRPRPKGGRGAKEGGRGAKEGGRGAKGGRGRDKDEKPATAKDLESQMDSYFAKTEKGKAKVAEEKVASKAKVAENLDSDLDSFMAKRAEAAPAAAAETADAPAATEAAADTA